MNTLRGRICRTEPEPEPMGAWRPVRPVYTLEEQDEAAEAFAAWWNGYRASNGRSPDIDDAVSANLPGIGRARWKAFLIKGYCLSTGMLARSNDG